MIAYLILVHRYPDQFKRLFKAIYHHSNHYTAARKTETNRA